MGIHPKAWEGLNILIYGEHPLLPMEVETAITDAVPSQELRIESFENYEQALDFCKSKKNVGLILLLEKGMKLPINSVFSELAKPYLSTGFTAFGVVINDGKESLVGLRAIKSDRRIIDYLTLSFPLMPESITLMMDNLWNQFVSSFKETLMPIALEETLFSLASQQCPNEDLLFLNRLLTLFSARLDVSWLETCILGWSHFAHPLMQQKNVAIASYPAIVSLVSKTAFSGDPKTFALNKDNGLPARIYAWAHYLLAEKKNGNLPFCLQQICASSKPGTPALMRYTSKLWAQIMKIADECSEASNQEKIKLRAV